MRKRIAPSSSYACPASTSRCASSWQRCMRSSWKLSASQSRPSQASERWICSVAPSTSRFMSVFSIRSRHSPPCWRAKSQLKRNVRAVPTWRNPVGDGAIRTRTDIRGIVPGTVPGTVAVNVRRVLRSPCVRLRRDRHDARPCGGDGRRRGAAVHAEPADVAADGPRSREPRAFKRRRAELGIAAGGVVAHALYLINLAAPDRALRNKSRAALRNTMEVACAIDADGVVFHVGSHLGAGMKTGLKRCVPALKDALELCTDTTWLLIEDSAGAGGTIGRSLDEIADIFDACDAHERLGVCLDTCHLFVSGVDIRKREVVDEQLEVLDDAHRPRPPPRAARQRRRRAARLEPRSPRGDRRGGARQQARRLPLASEAAGTARVPRRPGRRRRQDRHGRPEEGPQLHRRWCKDVPLADPRLGDARGDEPLRGQIGISAIAPDLKSDYGLSLGRSGSSSRRRTRA